MRRATANAQFYKVFHGFHGAPMPPMPFRFATIVERLTLVGRGPARASMSCRALRDIDRVLA